MLKINAKNNELAQQMLKLVVPIAIPPVWLVYIIISLDEIVKLPAVYLHYKKYVWVRNITR